jgi:hypothetical protein
MKTAMHDPKFEKAVQDKMEQLEFIPSDSVWENIEIAVAPRRRRRAVPVFFWFLLAGLMLAGAGTAIYLRQDTHSVAKNVSGSVPATATAGENAPMPANTQSVAHTPAETDRPAVTDPIKDAPVAPGTGTASGAGSAAERSVVGTKGSAGAANGRFSADGVHRTTANRHPDAGFTPDEIESIAAGSSIDAAPVTKAAPGTNATTATDAGPATGAASAINAARQRSSYQPGLISCVAAVSGIKGPRLSPSSGRSTAVTGIPMPKRPWSAGFAGGFGMSSYNQSLLSKATAVTTTTSALAAAVPSQFAPAASFSSSSSKKITSTVEPGLSYWAGVVAQKPLSARWSLSLGLDLHYYSSRLRVGGVVTTYSQSASALIGSSAIAPVQSYPYYSVGNVQVFTNRYYYLELPVAMQWQINRGRVLPLFLRGGVALSRLMSSNGLYYNDHSAVYFKENSIIQPMQVSFTSGLIATLPLRRIRIQAGPELQYGATTLLKGGAGNGHLVYGGLRVSVMR